MPPIRHQFGFTLLELLVSVSLTAVVLTILMTGLRLAQGAWRRGNERLAVIEENLAKGDAIQAQMSSALPRLLNTQFDQRQLQLISFRGDAKQIRFLSNYSWEGGRDFGLWLSRYRVAQESDGKEQLVVTETGLSREQQLVDFLLSNQPPPVHARPFGDRADRIEISYLRPSSPGVPASWVQEWKCEVWKQLPRGVRIHWQRGRQEQEVMLVIPTLEEAQ